MIMRTLADTEGHEVREANYYLQFTPVKPNEGGEIPFEADNSAHVARARAVYETRMRKLLEHWRNFGILDLGPVEPEDPKAAAQASHALRKLYIPPEHLRDIMIDRSIGCIVGPIKSDTRELLEDADANGFAERNGHRSSLSTPQSKPVTPKRNRLTAPAAAR